MSDPFGPQRQGPQQPQHPQQQPQQPQQQPTYATAPPPGYDPRDPAAQQGEAYMFPSNTIAARRRLVVVAAVVVVALVGGFVFLKSRGGESSTDKAAALVQVGLSAYQAGDYQTARSSYARAVEKDPNNAFAYYNLGLIQQVVDKDPVAAEASYRKAIAINSAFAQPLFNLGIIRANAGAIDEAIGLYRQAIAANPQFASAHFNLGLLLQGKDPSSVEAQTEITQGVLLDSSLESRIPTTTSTTAKRFTTTTYRRR